MIRYQTCSFYGDFENRIGLRQRNESWNGTCFSPSLLFSLSCRCTGRSERTRTWHRIPFSA